MKTIHVLALGSMLAGALIVRLASSQSIAGGLDDLRWDWRVVLVFRAHGDPSMRSLSTEVERLACQIRDRDMAVYVVDSSGIDALSDGAPTLPDVAAGDLRARLLERGVESQMVLIGKDGGVKARASDPGQLDRFLDLIDTMPMRRSEMRERVANCD